MNPLKKYPHLFANDKFKVEASLNDDRIVIADYVGVLTASVKQYEKRNSTETIYPYKIKRLIARPIESMADEELSKFVFKALRYSTNYTNIRNDLIRKANENTLSFAQAQKMLNGGVLPFPQTLFDDGTVININEI